MNALKQSKQREYPPMKYTSVCWGYKSVLLSEDGAEERHIGPELLRQGVEAREGPEVDHAVGGLGAILHRDVSSWRKRHLISLFSPLHL